MAFRSSSHNDASHSTFTDIVGNIVLVYSPVIQHFNLHGHRTNFEQPSMSCFEDAFQVSSDISARAQYAELHRAQLELLAASVSLLVNTLDRKCRDGYLLDRTVSVALENLNKYVTCD